MIWMWIVVSPEPVETELVFDRHTATDLSVAYAILVPPRRARTGRTGQEGRPQHDQRGDLRPGLFGPGRRKTRRSARRRRRCAHAEQQGLDVPDDWVFEDEGHSGLHTITGCPPQAGASRRRPRST